MKIYLSLLFTSFIFIFSTRNALAVPPPDFLFAVGASLSVVFSFLAIFFTVLLATIKQLAKKFFNHLKHKRIFWVSMAVLVIVVSFTGAYFFQQYEQAEAYKEWIDESEKQNQSLELNKFYLDKLTNEQSENQKIYDQEGNLLYTNNSTEPTPPEPKNPNIEFIESYYSFLSNREIGSAYAVSKKSVSIDTFTGWYQNVDSVQIDSLQEIDDDTYSLRVKLIENSIPTYYAVLLTIKTNEDGTRQIASSQSKVINATEAIKDNTTKVVENAETSTTYYNQKKNTPLEISDKDFKSIVDSSSTIFVLDAREDEEYGIGSFPGSTHIRFADLLSGQWVSLPTDETIYVFCWSGIRGEEVASFLREKGIIARYIENGADGWVSFGGAWNGGIKFSSKYGDNKYKKLFDLDGLKSEISKGTVIVDSRMSAKYEAWHIPESYNIPIIYTPTTKLQELLNQIPANSSVISVCDDFISCFDAKITGVKLEKNGHTFLGRYNKPWEYRNN